MDPLFIKSNKKPFTRTQLSCTLKACLEIERMPSDRYNTHSFRIGRLTQLAKDNATEATIKSTGRSSTLLCFM